MTVSNQGHWNGVLPEPPLAVGCPTLAYVVDPAARAAIARPLAAAAPAGDRALLVFSERLNTAGLSGVRLLDVAPGTRPIFRIALERVPADAAVPARDLGAATHLFELPAGFASALVLEEPADDPLDGPVTRIELDRAPEIPLRGRWTVTSKALGASIQLSWIFGAVESAGSWPSVWFPAEQPAPELDFENWQAVYGYTREDCATLASCSIARVVRLHGRAVVIVEMRLRPHVPGRPTLRAEGMATLHAVAFEPTERPPVLGFEITPG